MRSRIDLTRGSVIKNVLITGASRGIGRATAVLAGARGCSVGINYTANEQAAEEAARLVREAGGKATILKGDMSVEADVLSVFSAMQGEFGTVDGVVINAGIVAPALRLADMGADRLKRIFDVNIYGSYLCAREAARYLGRDRVGDGGSIVLVSSIAARLGAAGEYLDYAGSKAAMDTLAIGLSKELGPHGVRVNSVRPGLIDTEIHASGGQPDRAKRVGVAMPLGRAGTAEEVAEAIVWLLSDSASYVTGSILDIAGGR